MPPRRTSPRARARPEASSSVSASTSTTACATTTAEPSCSPPPLIRANSAPAELQLPSDQQPGQPALGCIKRRYTFFVGLAVGVLAPVSIWRAELSAGVSLGVGHVANYTNLSVGDSLNYLNYEQVVAGTSPSPDPSLGPSPSPSPSLILIPTLSVALMLQMLVRLIHQIMITQSPNDGSCSCPWPPITFVVVCRSAMAASFSEGLATTAVLVGFTRTGVR